MMILPTTKNILLVFIILFIIRYIVLKYLSRFIVNGYFSIFLSFFIITYIFTNNILFSTIIGLLSVDLRILYRLLKDKQTLLDYNSFSNCLAFFIALVLWASIIKNYKLINDSINKYYSISVFVLILINLGSLQINKNDINLMCYS